MEKIGEYLRDKRIKLGITLEEAEQSLKIRRKYLAAIEEGDESILPGKTYFVGYLRNYANYLQADQQYVDQLLDKSGETPKPVDSEPQIRKKRTSRYFSKKQKKLPLKKQKKSVNIIPLLGVFIAILLIGGFAFILNQFIHTFQKPSTSIVEKEVVTQEKTIEQEMLEIAKENIESEEIIETQEEEEGILLLAPLPDYKPIELVAMEPSWVKIIQNEQVLFEAIITTEEKITVKSEGMISLITTSPNQISVSYNDDILEPQPLNSYRLTGYQVFLENN